MTIRKTYKPLRKIKLRSGGVRFIYDFNLNKKGRVNR